MVQTQIELTEEQAKALEKIAHEQNIPLSDLIRKSIDQWLCSETPILPDSELKNRALAIAGRFKSGLGDLSKRHDDYFSGPESP